MADDPYSTLGVSKDASDDAIRRAFRDLAKELHPDRNPGNAAAEDRFKKVASAYDIVGDPEKRRLYDRGEIDARGEPRRGYAHSQGGARGGNARFDDHGFGDIFSDLFGDMRRGGTAGSARGFAQRGRDIRYTLEIDFVEAVTGARKRVTLPEGGVLDISVPEGVVEGQILRLKGKGSTGLGGGEPGDALVEIKVRAHAQFRRVGDDVQIDLPITLYEAVLGAKVEVPTITGRVQLTIPKATNSGQLLRLKGKGVRNLTTGENGDQLVNVRIVLPETITEGDTLSVFCGEWMRNNLYDPRKRG